MVRLIFTTSQGFCAGVLVDDDTIVTAAHCVAGYVSSRVIYPLRHVRDVISTFISLFHLLFLFIMDRKNVKRAFYDKQDKYAVRICDMARLQILILLLCRRHHDHLHHHRYHFRRHLFR